MIKNYYKPTPVHFRKIGDAMLYFTLAIQPLIMTLPLSSKELAWVMFGVQAIGIGGKTITNMFKENS